jgi:hypothetical protein
MNPIAPLILVFDQPAIELGIELATFVRRDTGVSYYDEMASPEDHSRLLYKGVELRVLHCDLPEDLASYRHIFFNSNLSTAIAGICIEFGGNVTGGARIAPLAQILMQFSAILGSTLGAIGVAWTPARLLSEPSYFANAVKSYVDGGAFPVLGTVDLRLANDTLTTSGLYWFSGQEIEIDGNGLSESEMVRRAVRIVHDIAVNGPVLVSQTVPDLDKSQVAFLSPENDGKIVSVKIQSDMEHIPV